MRFELITNYTSKVFIILMTLSLFSFIIPDIILLAKYWEYTEICYWVIFYYVFIIYIIIVRKIKYFYVTLINLVFSLIVLASFIAIGVNIIIKNTISPPFVILSCHILFEMIILVIIITYYIILSISGYNNNVIKYMFDINLYNHGYTLKEINKYYIYTYDKIIGKLEYCNKVQQLTPYEAYCFLCHNPYYSNEKVYFFGCHHSHIECGRIMLSNTTNCILCEMPITQQEDILY